jgi:hypothetical protein
MIYVRVIGAMVAAILVKGVTYLIVSPETLHTEVHGIGTYLGVVGGLYSIMVAFLIYVVWDQFNRVQSGLAHESSALEDLCRVATFLSERDAITRIRSAAKQYVKSTSGDEPPRLAQGKTSAIAEEHLGGLCHAVRSAEVKTGKDGVIYGELLGALTRLLNAREERLSVSATRVPQTLWHLVLFSSLTLFGGFLVLGVRSPLLSLGVVATVAGIMAFLLSVIKDMDNPFVGVWNVSYAPISAVARHIDRM